MKLQCKLTVEVERMTSKQVIDLHRQLVDIGFESVQWAKAGILESDWLSITSTEQLADLTVDLALLLEVDYGNLIVSRLEFKHE